MIFASFVTTFRKMPFTKNILKKKFLENFLRKSLKKNLENFYLVILKTVKECFMNMHLRNKLECFLFQ